MSFGDCSAADFAAFKPETYKQKVLFLLLFLSTALTLIGEAFFANKNKCISTTFDLHRTKTSLPLLLLLFICKHFSQRLSFFSILLYPCFEGQ